MLNDFSYLLLSVLTESKMIPEAVYLLFVLRNEGIRRHIFYNNCLQRIQAKVDLLATKNDWIVDLLATKADLQVIFEGKQVHALAKAVSNIKGSYINSSSSNSAGKNEEDDKPSKKKAKTDTKKKAKKESDSGSGGHWPSNFHKSGRGSSPRTVDFGDDDQTIIVKGIDSSLREDDIERALSKYFSSCGEITCVTVATDPVTGAAIGCAYIHLKKGVEKALKLSGSYLGGWNLVVDKVSPIGEVGGRFGPSGRVGHWTFPYRCNGLGHCGGC
ncbi:hypothetical protein AALP_AA8G075100 [Arabis alpina]|uniref:RRM domain-containing protein n=1 Tax=Arabis alpina TaxID=50452 RepID=A0A087G5L5_ARAAL|nr:hypothetical protein AALP_AA8G075100 [Arabis alpina]